MSSTAERELRVTDLLDKRARRDDRSPFEAVFDRIWRFLCSVRAAMYEMAFLALLVLIGTLKGSTVPAQLPRLLPFTDGLVRRWYQLDIYRTLLFQGTLALIAVAIIVCTINRVPGIWKSIAHPTVRAERVFFQRADLAFALSAPDAIGPATNGLMEDLKRRRYRVTSVPVGEQIHVYADKNRYGRLGTFPFHLGLILVLVGAIVGGRLGFRETVFAVPEGSVRDVGHGTGLRLMVERFSDSYNEIGAATAYRSDLVLYDGEREVKRQSVTVNHPMTYRTTTFYQASYGPAATVRVTDAAGRVVFDDGVAFLYTSRSNMNAPAAMVELPVQRVRLELIYPDTKLTTQPEIGGVKLKPGEMFVQARDWQSNQIIGAGRVVGQGTTASFGDITFEFVREKRFAVLQVAYNPGAPILVAASVIGLLGLAITFGFPHRRIRAIIEPEAGGSIISIAPLARRDWGGKRDFVDTLARIERRFGDARPIGGWSLDSR